MSANGSGFSDAMAMMMSPAIFKPAAVNCCVTVAHAEDDVAQVAPHSVGILTPAALAVGFEQYFQQTGPTPL